MISVKVGNNLTRTTKIVDPNTTLRSVLDDAGINYTVGMMNLNGTPLDPEDLDKTFADFGVTDKCFLTNVIKADNAA